MLRRGVLVVATIVLVAAGFVLTTRNEEPVCLYTVTAGTGPHSTAKRYEPAPDVVGLTIGRAGDRLNRAGFDLLERVPCESSSIKQVLRTGIRDPRVIEQSRPLPGTDGRFAVILTTEESE
jgi:hypothetical protein